MAQEQREKYGTIVWRRASEIYGTPLLFRDVGVAPEDIEQGFLGNGYFLTVLSSMAAQPERIFDLFETKEYNSAGIYMVYLYVNGIRTAVVIDDYIPVWPQNNQPVFAKAKNDALWVSLLEKAWAKLHGTYCRSESNSPNFAASHLSKYLDLAQLSSDLFNACSGPPLAGHQPL